MPDVIIKGMEMPENCAECELYCNTGGIWEIGEDYCCVGSIGNEIDDLMVRQADCPLSPAPEWISVEERLPEAAGNYIVAYHPCYWDDVKYQVTNVGIDAFRGKTTWAKNKHQRVTHWMPLPEPPEVK